ncbi:hypothetical protein C8R44DRAFT_768218 [Mycena epipterygia]|nr:hypothetical protein C8R44DRAFT_768218 [Mycena epipterygia]
MSARIPTHWQLITAFLLLFLIRAAARTLAHTLCMSISRGLDALAISTCLSCSDDGRSCLALTLLSSCWIIPLDPDSNDSPCPASPSMRYYIHRSLVALSVYNIINHLEFGLVKLKNISVSRFRVACCTSIISWGNQARATLFQVPYPPTQPVALFQVSGVVLCIGDLPSADAHLFSRYHGRRTKSRTERLYVSCLMLDQ